MFNERAQAVVGNIALTVRGGVEIHAVDDSFEFGIFFGNGAQMIGQLLADFIRQFADDRPDRFIRFGRLERNIKTHQLLVGLDHFKCFGAPADFLGDAVEFVVEYVTQPLGKNQRQDEILIFGGFLRAANRTGRVPQPALQ